MEQQTLAEAFPRLFRFLTLAVIGTAAFIVICALTIVIDIAQ